MTFIRRRPSAFRRAIAPGALIGLALSCTATSDAIAQADPPPAPEGPPSILNPELEQAARDAVERLIARLGLMLDGLGLMIENLPAYDAPRMLPNGDILIPRRRPAPAPEPAPDAPETLDL